MSIAHDLARFARDLASEPLPGVRAQQFGQYVAHRLAEPVPLTTAEVEVLTACLLWSSIGGPMPAVVAAALTPKSPTILDGVRSYALRSTRNEVSP